MRKQITLILLVFVLILFAGCTKTNDLSQNTDNSSFSGSKTKISETITSPDTIIETTDTAKETPPTLTIKNDESTEETEKSPDTSFSGSKETESSKPTEAKDEKPTTQTEQSKPADTTSETKIEPDQPKQTEPTQTVQIADRAEVERKIAEYINGYRSTNATVLSGLTQVARYRSQELVSNFIHTDGISACNALKYGEYVDMTEYGMSESDSYYQGYNREAIAKGNWVGSADEIAKRIADGFKKSSSHWKYLGSSEYSYMAVGCTYVSATNTWYCCICVSDTNYGD